MKKMMTYSDANQILGCSLTPNNRCICKETAIDHYADPAPLASFTNNRLVPVDYVNLVEYTVTYNNDVTGDIITRSVSHGSTAPSITPWTISGYTFDHWNKPFGTVTGNDTYTAYYTPNPEEHTVTFIYDGSTWNTQTVVHGGYATEPSAPTKPGYTFAGWSVNGSIVSVASTLINGDTTFTAQFTEDAPPVQPVVMLADVGWKTADDGGGIPHGDPTNGYELDQEWIPSNRIPIHVWFEPMYTSNGTELSYTDTIATVNGVNVSHNDLLWTASLGTSTSGYNYWWSTLSGSYSQYEAVMIMPLRTMDDNDEWVYPTRNWRVKETSNNSELLWLDEIPFTLTGTYNGITVVQKTMTIVCYKASIAGYINVLPWKGSRQGWVKSWGTNP